MEMKKMKGILSAVLLALLMTACGGESSGAQEQDIEEESSVGLSQNLRWKRHPGRRRKGNLGEQKFRKPWKRTAKGE